MDSPDQNALGLALSDVAQKDATIEMKLRMVNGSFKGTLSADGAELNGEWSQSGVTLPLKLKRITAK
jgi:hypothetical protein